MNQLNMELCKLKLSGFVILAAMFIFCAGSFADAQTLAVYNDGQQIQSGSVVDIVSTFSQNTTSNQDYFYQPSMPALGVAYVSKGGICGQIDYTVDIKYDGHHFMETIYHRKTATTKGYIEYFTPSTDYDTTTMPTISGTVDCNQQIQPIQWNDSFDQHYGGNLTIQWYLDSDPSDSGTINLTVYGTNPSNQDFDDALSYLAGNYVPELPMNWLESMFVLESAADSSKSSQAPKNQYHQFFALDGANSGNPNDTCGCPEGVGVAQIDFNAKGANGHTIPQQIPLAGDIFWDWYANLAEGIVNHLAPAKQNAVKNWNADTANAQSYSSSALPPQSVTKLSSACQLTDSDHASYAYEMDGYNSGPGNPRFTKFEISPTTNTGSWKVAHTYFADLCKHTAL